MKTMIYDTLTKVFERESDESVQDWLEFYEDIESILAAAKTEYGIWVTSKHTDERITIELVTQTIWLDEKQTAWFFSNVLYLFRNDEGKPMYNAEAMAFAEDRMNVIITEK